MNQEEYNYLVSVTHAYHCKENAEDCVCKGCGYFLTDFDTWEKCPHHYVKGISSPEDY